MDFLTVPYIVNKYKDFKESFGNTDNNDNSSSAEELTDVQQALLIAIFVVAILIIAALYYWAFMLLFTFNLPFIVIILCILFLLIGNPLFAIIFAYIFKDKNLNMTDLKTSI